jgi:hypothetical protein
MRQIKGSFEIEQVPARTRVLKIGEPFAIRCPA